MIKALLHIAAVHWLLRAVVTTKFLSSVILFIGLMKKKNRLRVLPFILFFSLHIHLCTFAVFLSLSLFTFLLFFIPLECPCGRARLALAHLLYICSVSFIITFYLSFFFIPLERPCGCA
ncbi:hypothetical protein BDB00DRAFT_210904 [Zychaea mexicana]|uniref:uncharacterized protein n=1 Tax=Zychaea mexicana TaxID=64656 RepID=UPI0022FE8A51|nr:uncharacterized protein BDB00DRAFT_210904 [Zychaea mexicana]KAI9495693.1 hypothetical protein BDB00DRAFT_210904 [Zychaea mexicana]